jgi:hypothetical protein
MSWRKRAPATALTPEQVAVLRDLADREIERRERKDEDRRAKQQRKTERMKAAEEAIERSMAHLRVNELEYDEEFKDDGERLIIFQDDGHTYEVDPNGVVTATMHSAKEAHRRATAGAWAERKFSLRYDLFDSARRNAAWEYDEGPGGDDWRYGIPTSTTAARLAKENGTDIATEKAMLERCAEERETWLD